MSSIIDKFNRNFLSDLSGAEKIGVDKDGRLFAIKEKETTTSKVAQDLLKTNKKVHDIAATVVKDKIKEGNPDEVMLMIDQFAKSHLLNHDQLNKLSLETYDKKYALLLANFEESEDFDKMTAEAIITAEMAFDPHLSESLREKIKPELSKVGIGGTYFLKNRDGKIIGVFKPKMQEYKMPFNPKGGKGEYNEAFPLNTQLDGHIQGTSWLNEIAAYEISNHYMGVPDTTEISLLFPTAPGSIDRRQQVGSFQRFVPGKPAIEVNKESLDVAEVQKIALFDLLLVNGDRNTNNILVQEDGTLVPIDHGLAFLVNYELRSEWRFMPQLKQPVKQKLKNWITNFDINESCQKLKDKGVHPKAIFIHRVMHMYVLTKITQGKTLEEITKDCSTSKFEDTTKIEQLVEKAKESLSGKDKENEEVILKRFAELIE